VKGPRAPRAPGRTGSAGRSRERLEDCARLASFRDRSYQVICVPSGRKYTGRLFACVKVSTSFS
jgi:hypothetical protein